MLGRIFKNIGADPENKLLDSNNDNLSADITNEFINNNINVSYEDLQLFIELFLNKKQNTGWKFCFNRFFDFIENYSV